MIDGLTLTCRAWGVEPYAYLRHVLTELLRHAAGADVHASRSHASDPDRHQGAALYRARHPEQTLLYNTIAGDFATWLRLGSAGQFDGQGENHIPPAYVKQAFRKYLEFGIFAHGFARACYEDCGHDFFITYSCKGRCVFPFCNTCCIAETAAHFTYHVFPHVPVRQWMLSVPKQLRYFLKNDGKALNAALRIFLRVTEPSLQQNCPGAAGVDQTHIGACAFIQRSGSKLMRDTARKIFMKIPGFIIMVLSN